MEVGVVNFTPKRFTLSELRKRAEQEVGLEVFEKRKISLPCRDSNPGSWIL
jgi:hypothetical protein